MQVFERSVTIRTTPERLFDFHTDTRNLKRISPAWMQTTLVRDEGDAGDRKLDLRVSSFWVPMLWHVEISEYDRPLVLSDLVTKGPFKYFHHRRTFVGQDNGTTVMTDRLEYELPLGILGRLAGYVIVRQLITRMFAYRHKRTKELLENAA